jgi:hypothetical protein
MFCVRNNKKLGRSALRKVQALACLLLLFLAAPEMAFSQAWKAGRSSLMKNDFKTAKNQLSAAVKKSRPGQELAETYKYLGVAHYMSGDKNSALQAFRLAKSNYPSVKLNPNEVLDESVISLFNQANNSRAAASASRGITRSAKKGVQSLPRQNQSSVPAISRQKSKRTLLKVVSNVPSAAVSIDGINYGSAGQEMEVPPGTVILEVAANGFKSKAIKVKLQPLTSSLVNVNLEKIIIAPKPRPVPSVTPLTQSKIPLPGQPRAVAGKKPSANKNDLFGDDPMGNQSFIVAPPAAPLPQVVTPPPAPAQPVMPQQGYAQPGYAQPGYAQPPTGYPMPPQYAPSPYPVYPQYAPMQPYGAPVYPAAPYGGYMAPPNPYAYPPTPAPYAPPPMADPYGGYLGPPPEASVADPGVAPLADGPGASGGGLPPPPISPTESSQKAKSKNVAQDKCGMIRLLPFGAGQFCNGSTLKGAAFLGGQVASLYFYRTNSTSAVSVKKKLDAYLQERVLARDETTEDLSEFDAETIQKEKETNDTIAKANQNAQFSMVSFVGLWGIGVLDAYINKPVKTNKKKTKKPRITLSYDLDLDTAPLGTWAIAVPNQSLSKNVDVAAEYKLGYTPVRDFDTNNILHSLTFGVTLDL